MGKKAFIFYLRYVKVLNTKKNSMKIKYYMKYKIVHNRIGKSAYIKK